MKKILLITAYLLAELIMFSIYNGHKASFHWFTHYYVGAIVALLGLSIWKLSTHRSVVWPLGWLYLGHLLAMIPDLLYDYAHIPHRLWMDVFLGHISSHFIPGRNWTWYVLFLLSLSIYLIVTYRANAQTAQRENLST
jgi:hypothetical protein